MEVVGGFYDGHGGMSVSFSGVLCISVQHSCFLRLKIKPQTPYNKYVRDLYIVYYIFSVVLLLFLHKFNFIYSVMY